MKYPNAEYRAREARAKNAVRNLLTQCSWEVVEGLTFLPTVFREGVNVRGADLVMIASGGDHPFGLNEALREVPLDVLIVEPAILVTGEPTLAATLVRRRRGRIIKKPCLRFWFDGKGACFLQPDSQGDDPNGTCFALTADGVREADQPWTSESDREFGRFYADAVLLKP